MNFGEHVRAAGGIVWKAGPGARRLAVIHRPHREDWSLPKGKLQEGEGFEEAALREVAEETGCEVRLGAFAGTTLYVSRRGPKIVLYWHMALVREGKPPSGEVDEVVWLTPAEALRRLDNERDRRLLRGALAGSEAASGHDARRRRPRTARAASAAAR